jgi:F0F1-type ATP synthase assembly protein I
MSITDDVRKSIREAGEAHRKSATYMTVGIQIVVAFVLFVFGGYKLDSALNTTPIFLLVGVVLALIAMFTVLWRLATPSSTRPVSETQQKKTAQ